MVIVIFLIAIVGFIISLYSYLLQRKVEVDPNYHATCDINDRISCTKPMRSEYTNIFYISNSIVGMAYYGIVAILALGSYHTVLLITSVGGVAVSTYFAYLLYFKIKAICIICTVLYLINIVLLCLTAQGVMNV